MNVIVVLFVCVVVILQLLKVKKENGEKMKKYLILSILLIGNLKIMAETTNVNVDNKTAYSLIAEKLIGEPGIFERHIIDPGINDILIREKDFYITLANYEKFNKEHTDCYFRGKKWIINPLKSYTFSIECKKADNCQCMLNIIES